ncbi:MAG TPA: xanthine dehydrogenase family protein molybdopterin-binding subunit [Rectinemataceae bacterium]|nr:xanthine dehydrogenase family protein molybdopterin-binding subunit [Rectinemataceae bacterium]
MIVPFTPRVDRQFIGKYRPKVDGREKASGKAVYADDLSLKSKFPGLLYAKVLRSPYAHAKIRSLDLRAALAYPGVVDILTYADPDVASLKKTNAGWTDGVDTVSYRKMMWGTFRDRFVLGDTANWVGDEVGAAVVAESELAAEEGLRLIKVDWEVLPFVLDPYEAMKPGAALVHPDITQDNIFPPDPFGGEEVFVDKGDVVAGLATAEVRIECRSVYHNATQGSLDNWCCVVDWKEEELVVWSNSYAVDQTRMHVSQMLGLPIHRVRAVSPYVGGQFGRGDTGDQPFFLFTAILSKRSGRPVKFKHTRRESFHDSRQPADYSARIGAKRDGTIVAMHFKSVGNAGAYADHSMFALKYAPKEITEVALAHIPNVRFETRGVYTNKLPACMMRGVGNSQFNLIFGQVVDALAEKLGMDPVELAIRNFGHEWESLPDASLSSVLGSGASRIGWKEKRHAPGKGPVFGDRKRRGVGFSFHPAWHAEWQEVRRGKVQVSITLNPDCTVLLNAPSVETGNGSNTCNVLGCAEALRFLGVALEDIRWGSTVDTAIGLKDCVQTDSAVSFLQSEVMAVAAIDLKARLAEIIAPVLGVAESEVEIVAGEAFAKSAPGTRMAVRDILLQGDLAPITVVKSRSPLATKTGVPYIANFAEVEVDEETGKVEVLKLVVINDCGTVMYASGAEAQQIGGQVIGLGETLTEEIVYDKATGVPLNFNWIDYRIPTMADMPDIEPVLLEVWKGAGEYGACGIGEGTVTCTPRAILNAIYNAIGVRVDEIPATPEKVLAALAATALTATASAATGLAAKAGSEGRS